MKKISLFDKELQIFFLVYSVYRLTSSMIYPFMAIYLSRYFSIKETGLMLLIIGVLSMIANLVGGHFSDAIGRKNSVLISELVRFFSFFFMAIYSLGGLDFHFSIFILLAINNFAFGFGHPSYQSMIIDLSNSENRRDVYTITYWILNACVAIGSMVGAFLFDGHFILVLIITCLSCLINIILTFFLINNENTTRKSNIKSSLTEVLIGYIEVGKNKIFLKFIIAGLLVGGLEAQFTNFIVIRLENQFGTKSLFEDLIPNLNIEVNGVEVLGILKTENTIIILVITTVVMAIMKKFSDLTLINIGLFLFTIGYAVLAMSNNFLTLFLFTFILSIGEILFGPPTQVLLSNLTENHNRSKYMALNSLSIRGATLLGSLGILLSGVFPNWSISLLYLLIGIISAFLYFSVYKSLNSKKSERTVNDSNGKSIS